MNIVFKLFGLLSLIAILINSKLLLKENSSTRSILSTTTTITSPLSSTSTEILRQSSSSSSSSSSQQHQEQQQQQLAIGQKNKQQQQVIKHDEEQQAQQHQQVQATNTDETNRHEPITEHINEKQKHETEQSKKYQQEKDGEEENENEDIIEQNNNKHQKQEIIKQEKQEQEQEEVQIVHKTTTTSTATTTTTTTTTATNNNNNDNNHVHDYYYKEQIPSNDLLLNVPFYVYEELIWLNATINGKPVQDAIIIKSKYDDNNINNNSTTYNKIRYHKHSDDYWFMVSSLQHPMRTYDPSKAKIFIIPLMMNLYSLRYFQTKHPKSRKNQGFFCYNNLCDIELLQYASKILKNSIHYQKSNGKDHLVVTSHFAYTKVDKFKPDKFYLKSIPNSLRNILYSCNNIIFENRYTTNHHKRFSYPSTYVGYGCPTTTTRTTTTTTTTNPTITTSTKDIDTYTINNDDVYNNNNILKNKEYDLALIASLKYTSEVFQDRRNLCKWIRNQTNTKKTATTMNRTNSSTTTNIINLYSNTITTNNNRNRLLSLNNEEDQQQQHLSLSTIRTPTMLFCGSGPQCPTLSKSIYGFHVRGDTYGSQRLMDTLLSGTIPIFTNIHQYDTIPNSKFLNWSKLSYFINLNYTSATTNGSSSIAFNTTTTTTIDNNDYEQQQQQQQEYILFWKQLQNILHDINGTKEKLITIHNHRMLFDWTTSILPFDFYMYMLQKDLYPNITTTSNNNNDNNNIENNKYNARIV